MPSGIVRETGEYAADKKHKEWKTFDEQGKQLSSVVFKAGTSHDHGKMMALKFRLHFLKMIHYC